MGLSWGFSTVVALLGFTLLQESRSQRLTECSTSSSTDFDYEVTLGAGFDIRWSVDTEAEAISFEVSTAAQAWISVGFSSDGMMIGSDAVIGLPDSSAVEEYILRDQDLEMVVLAEEQEISAGTVTQGTNITTLTFTRFLAPNSSDKETLSATAGDETWLIYAFGTGNELAYHGPNDNRGNALLDLFCGDTRTESDAPTATPPTPTPSGTLAPLLAGETFTPTSAPVGDGDGGGGGGSSTTETAAPSAVEDNASSSPVDGADDGEDPTTEGDAAFRVNGGLWVAAATVTSAMLGVAMAV